MFGRPDSRDSMLCLSVRAVVRGCVPGSCKAPKKSCGMDDFCNARNTDSDCS